MRAWTHHAADATAEEGIICPTIRNLMELLESDLRGVEGLSLVRQGVPGATPPKASRLMDQVRRDAVLTLPFGHKSQGRAVVYAAIELSNGREEQAATQQRGLLPS